MCQQLLTESVIPNVDNMNPQLASSHIMDMLYDISKKSIASKVNNTNSQNSCNSKERWDRIMRSDDAKLLWHSINWKGSFSEVLEGIRPSDDDFKEYMEELLNPENIEELSENLCNTNVTIPVSDNPITALVVGPIA